MDNATIDFLESIFLRDKLPDFYESSHNDFSKGLCYSNPNTSLPSIKHKIAIVKDIPSYISLKAKNRPKNIKQVNIDYYKGFSINFEGIKDTESYLKTRFGGSSRYKLRRSIKRLENAFNINYKMFYGQIDSNDYNLIFDEFFKLLKQRSIEKGIDNNTHLLKKEYYHKIVYPLILKKQASLFVIFNGKKPIDICLNFHKDAIVFQLIRTYDIYYSKFNLGYIDLIKQIEWCLANQINFITFSYGSFYWKKRWCNSTYNYQFSIFYNKSSIKSRIKAFNLIANLKLRHALREKGLIDLYHEKKDKVKSLLNPQNSRDIVLKNIDYKIHIDTESEINVTKTNLHFVKKAAYDFLFNSNENEKNLKVYKITDTANSYLIKGKKSKLTAEIK